MNKKMLRTMVSSVMAVIMLASSFAVFASDEIITPWNTTYNFDGASFNWDGSLTTDWNKWISTYTQIVPYTGCTVQIKDSYTDSEENAVYDSVSGIAGDKYIYFKPNTTVTDNEDGTTTSTTTSTRTGYLYLNPVSSTPTFKAMNGGLCYNKVTYEFDIRVDELSGADWSGGKVNFYTSDNGARKTLLSIALKHGNSNNWYITYKNSDQTDVSPKAFTCGDWIRFKVTIDVPNKVWYLSYKPVKTVAESDSETKNIGPLTLASASQGIPAGTNISIENPKYCAISFDNLSVTKDAFVVDESKTTITEDETKVNASVTVGNCVYADASTQFGDAVPTTSPVAILALYKTDGTLISVDFKNVEYTESHNPSSGTEKEAMYKSAPDYQEISLSLDKPGEDYVSKVYIWDSMVGMIPYVASYPAAAAN